mgnify:CR=1 FL=1
MSCPALEEIIISSGSLEVLAQDSSEISFGTSGKRAVIVRQVEMSDTMIECILNHVGCHIEIVHTTEVCHNPKEIKGNCKPLLPQYL